MNLSLGPLVSAIAAGNSAIIKPSEMTPNAAQVITDIVEEAFTPDLVRVIVTASPGSPIDPRAWLFLSSEEVAFDDNHGPGNGAMIEIVAPMALAVLSALAAWAFALFRKKTGWQIDESVGKILDQGLGKL